MSAIDYSCSAVCRRRSSAQFRCGRAAFTIIELMLAIAIFTGVLISIYATWSGVLRGSRIGLAAAADAQRKRITLRAIEEALGSVQNFAVNARYYGFLADTSGDFASVSFVSRLPPSFPGSGLFPGQPLRRVTFEVERGERAIPQLVLRQVPVLEPPEPTVQPYKIVLSPEINVFQLEFWDLQKGEWIPEWLNTNVPPRMVRISLGFGTSSTAGPAPDQTVASRVVLLPGMPMPRAFQVPPLTPGSPLVAPPATGNANTRNAFPAPKAVPAPR